MFSQPPNFKFTNSGFKVEKPKKYIFEKLKNLLCVILFMVHLRLIVRWLTWHTYVCVYFVERCGTLKRVVLYFKEGDELLVRWVAWQTYVCVYFEQVDVRYANNVSPVVESDVAKYVNPLIYIN